eukprot:50284_1
MAMSDCGSTISSSMSDAVPPFNFDQWIQHNDFQSIKQLFITHEMNTFAVLSLHSNKFPKFIQSVSAEKPTYVEKICHALQVLSAKTTAQRQKNGIIKKIRASDEEFAVEEAVQNDIKQLQSMKGIVLDAQKKQIEFYLNGVNEKFDAIATETNKQKQNLCDEIKGYLTQNTSHNPLLRDIEHLTQYSNDGLARIEQLLEGVNTEPMNRKERKRIILQIGNEIRTRYEMKRTQFETELASLKDNNQVPVNAVSYRKLMKYLKKFGKLRKGDDMDATHITKKEEHVMEMEAKEDVTHAIQPGAPIGLKPPVMCNQSTQKTDDRIHGLRKTIRELKATLVVKSSTEIALRAQIEKKQNELNETVAIARKERAGKDNEIKKINANSAGLIKKIMEQINEKEAINKQINEDLNTQRALVEPLQAKICDLEQTLSDILDEERKETNAYQNCVKELQSNLNVKQKEILKLRKEINKQRAQSNATKKVVMSKTKTKAQVARQVKKKPVVMNYAATQSPKSNTLRDLVNQMTIGFSGNNAKEFVDSFVKIGGYRLECNVKQVKNQKQVMDKTKQNKKQVKQCTNNQAWWCNMEIKTVKGSWLIMECEDKQKKKAIARCYWKLATKINQY